jgi:hypothetical protein
MAIRTYLCVATTLLGYLGPANAETVYLTCRSTNGPDSMYVTFDTGKAVARAYPRPQEGPWRPAAITDATVNWVDHHSLGDDRFSLNRYSGTLQYIARLNSGGGGVFNYACERSKAPTKRF